MNYYDEFKKSGNQSRHGLLLAVVLVALAFVGPAQAQIDEIIVTANKREQTLQDTPLTVAVVDAETIKRAQIIDIIDLQTAVPALRINQLQSSANTNFLIRGFGNGANNPGIEPSVSVVVDGVVRTRSASSIADLPTLERIEVLSGPQSTLFGKNASAGVISISTRAPEREFGGSAEITFGNYGSTLGKGTLTGPISENWSYRVSGSSNRRDGTATNLLAASDKSLDAELNNRDRFALRGQLLYESGDALRLRLIADHNEIDENCCVAPALVNGDSFAIAQALAAAKGYGSVDPVDPWARAMYVNFNPRNRAIGKGLSAQLDYDFGFATLTSISAYREQSSEANTDGDFSAAELLRENIVAYRFDTRTQELRLTSNGEDGLQWMLGAFYFEEDLASKRTVIFDVDTYAYFNGLISGVTKGSLNLDSIAALLTLQAAGLPTDNPSATLAASGLLPAYAALKDSWYRQGDGVRSYFDMRSEARSVFAQVDYALSDALSATLGVNYTEDEKQVRSDVTITDAFATLPFAGTPFAGLQPFQLFRAFRNYPNADESGIFESDEVTYSARLVYDVSDQLNVYVGTATGFKAASVNLTIDGRGGDIGRIAEPEEAELFEIGLKAQFDRGYVNLALFDQSIKGFQSNLFNGLGFNLVNAGQQTHRGLEFSGMLRLTDHWRFDMSGMWLDAEYDSFARGACDTSRTGAAADDCPPGQPFVDLSGRTPAGIHEISLNANTTFDFELTSGIDGFVRLEYVYEDEIQVVDNVAKEIASRDTQMLNASVGIGGTDDSWSLMLWGRNLTDHESLISAFPTTAAPGSYSGYPNQPRTYGITLRTEF